MVSMTRKAIIGALALGLVTAGAAVAQDQRGQDQRSQDQRGWGNNGWGQNNNTNNGHGWNQERAEATLFREMNFRGTPVVLRGENANINISWNPRSVRVQSGVRCSVGRAGAFVHGCPPTGTGCWRGA